MKPSEIRFNYKYRGASGYMKLVTSFPSTGKGVTWQTTELNLPAGVRSHGSCTLASFAREAKDGEKATREDWEVFDLVARLRGMRARDARWKRGLLNALTTMRASALGTV
jgi:hypothetical protein